jgi:MFS family permease
MEEILFNGIWPALLVAYLALGASYKLWRPKRQEIGCDWGVALAVGGGFLAGALGAAGMPDRWPLAKWEWIFVAAALLTLAALPLALSRLRPWRWIMGPLAVLLAFSLLSDPRSAHLWETGEPIDWMWKLTTAAAVGALWALVEPLARKRPGVSLPLALLPVVISAAYVIMLSGNDRLSRMLGAAAAALGVCLLVAFLRPNFVFTGGATAILALAVVGLLALARRYSYTEIPAAAYLLPALAPALPWIVELKPLRRLRPWQSALLRLALIAIPCGLAMYLAASNVETDLYY